MVDFQFHFNLFNGVEKIMDEKNNNIHPSIHPHVLNEKLALFDLWTRPHVIFGKTLTCENASLLNTTICDFNRDYEFRSLYLRTLWNRACRETDYNTSSPCFALDKIKIFSLILESIPIQFYLKSPKNSIV